MERTKIAHILLRTVQTCVALLLIGVPFPFGSVQPQWLFTLENGICILLLLWIAAQIAEGEISLVVTWRDTMRAASDFSLTGAGLGSFRSVFPRYKTGSFGTDSLYAESEYLEWILETGIMGSILLLLVGWAFARDYLPPDRPKRCNRSQPRIWCNFQYGQSLLP